MGRRGPSRSRRPAGRATVLLLTGRWRDRRVVAAAAVVAAGAALLGWTLVGHGGKEKLTIGVLAPTGDPRGRDLVAGAELAATQINNDGGVLGRKVALEVLDDACSPQAGASAARSLADDGVSGVVGGACDGAAAREVPIVDEAGIPFLVTTANGTELVRDVRQTYLLNGTLHQQAFSASYWMNYRRAQRLAIVGDESPDSQTIARETVSAIDRVPQLVSLQKVPVDKRDLRIEAEAALHSHPDFVFWTGSAAGGGALVKALRALGFKGTFTASAASESPAFLEAAGDAAEGAFVTATAKPDNMPDAAPWRARFRAAKGHEPGLDALQAYDGVRALAQAARQAGGTNRDAVAAQLPALSPKLTTFIGPIRLARDHTLLYDNRVILVVKNGSFGWERSLRTDTLQG
jgi:branched-chain amino acid transport system substrate-binding protein